MEQPATIMPMTKDEFWKTYWFSPLQMVTLVNPKYDYTFMVEGRNFFIKSGATEKLPGTVANVYLSQMSRIMAQDDDKMQYLSDFALMRQYYDKLIVDVENMVKEVSNTPAYLSDVPAHVRASDAPETPPWQQPAAPQAPVTPPVELPKEAEPTTKEFELEGSKFRMTIDKNDKETYFKDGRRVDASTYAKAASMV
jgi:hypothetical protein